MSKLLDYLVEHEPSFRKARLPALYSDFRSQRALNPDGYHANVAAWRRALAQIPRSGLAPPPRSGTTPDLLVLDCDDRLLAALESKQYGRPLALSAAVAEALSARDLVPLPEFLSAHASIYQKSSTWNFRPWALAAWALRQLRVGGDAATERLPTGRFVVVANVEEMAAAFGEKLAAESGRTSRFERTFTKEHFRRVFGEQIGNGNRLSETDVDVLLTFLSRDKGTVLYDGKIVRIKAAGSSEEAATLVEEDASIAQIKELIEYLAHQTTTLTRRTEELAAAARSAVARGQRGQALAALRSKKLTETSLDSRLASLSQLEAVAARLEQASDNAQIVHAMEAGSEALRSLNAAADLSRVEDVVDRLREQVAQTDEVSAILAEGQVATVEEAEVDDELEQMEAEERRKQEASERRKVEEEQEREAQETKRRLDALAQGPLKPLEEGDGTNSSKEKEEHAENHASTQRTSTEEVVGGLRRMSLQPLPQADPA
ncbi:hypothetical protein VTK73DRAFT_6949 [Phialemonium thermophilum]|uniref:Snf7 family protein n=1 Tax=Phialemonium thermophilum TaxID=223376 RepID=A0ABR3XV47_9PEZI